jgi:hypothetical protein
LDGSGNPVLVYYQLSGGNRVQRTDGSGNLIWDLSDQANPVPIYLETTTNTGQAVMVKAPNPLRDEVTFRNISRVTVNTLGGDDAIIMENTAAPPVIRMGVGDDTIVVGIVPQINDPGNVTLEYPLGIPIADTLNMTNGNSHVVTVYGGDGDDEFEVNHNAAKLFLSGENGDDTFIINTFLVLTDASNQQVANLATLFGGAGSNRYQYLQNAPVYISGGAGIDTIVINGTPIRDVFIVTSTSIVGAGRIVYFTGIERLEINSASGDDEIYVLSSPTELEVTVRGGSGNDNIHLGGNPEALIFDPPAFEYQPPSYQVQDAPVDAVLGFTMNLGYVTFTVSDWWWFWDSNADYTAAIRAYIDSAIAASSRYLPGLRAAPSWT